MYQLHGGSLMGIPGFWLFVVSEVMLATLLFIVIPYLHYPAGKAFAGMVFSSLLWVSLYTLQLSSSLVWVKVLAMRIEFIGITLLPITFFILSVLITGQKVIRAVWTFIALMSLMFLVTIWFIPVPNAFWSLTDVEVIEPSSLIRLREYGPMFYYLFIPYTHGMISFSIFVLVRKLRKEQRYYWRQVMLFSIGMLLPLGINFIHIIGLTPNGHVNYGTASMGLSALIIGYTLLKYKFLNYLPVTRDVVIEAMSDGILVFDRLGYLLDANSSAEYILGRTNMIGRKIDQVLPSDLLDHIAPSIREGGATTYVTQDGQDYYENQLTPLSGISGYQSGYLLSIRDISEKERYHREVQRMARLDPLTGVLNRRTLFEEMEQYLVQIRQGKGVLSLFMLDIDDFKKVNDSYGHDAGDRAIHHLKEILLTLSGPDVLVGRFGGDEFLVACPGLTQEKTVLLAESILKEVTLPQQQNHGITLNVSVGVISSETIAISALTSDHMLNLADEMLYQAKRRGKNRVCSPSDLSAEQGGTASAG